MNGEHKVMASVRAIIEECRYRAMEEDVEGVPSHERFRVISHEAGLFAFIVANVTKRRRIAVLDGNSGVGSIVVWLAGGISESDASVFGWEANPRRHIKLQNSLTRAGLGDKVELYVSDPVLEVSENGIEALTSAGLFDMIVVSLKEQNWEDYLNVAWDILSFDGLILITDTIEADESDRRAIDEFFSARSCAVVGIEQGEGISFGIKLKDSDELMSGVANSKLVGEKAAARLAELEAGNRKPGSRYWAIPPETGKFFWILLRSMKPSRALEIGASSGYSGIWISSAIKNSRGRLTTIDVDSEKISLAKESYRIAGVDDAVDLIEGDARDLIGEFEEKFDFIFLDCDKAFYLPLFDELLTILNPGGILMADNIISHRDELKSYVDTVQDHSGVVSVTVQVGSGEEMTLLL